MTHRIDEIERRLKAATDQAEAPWRVERLGSITPWTGALSIGYGPKEGCSHLAHTTRGFEGDGTDCDSSAQAIANFIAHAPTDVAHLLDEIRTAHREIAQMQVAMNEAGAALDRKSALLDTAHREIAEVQSKLDKAIALADVFQKQFMEHTAHVKTFLLQLSEISGPLFDPSDKVTIKEMCAALIAAAEHQRQWAHEKTAELTTAHRERDEIRAALSAAIDTLEDRCTLKDGGGYIECVVCCVQWHDTVKLGHKDDCPIRIGRALTPTATEGGG
jgi:chromosome segregation ATPase